jgi:hypothetical protein
VPLSAFDPGRWFAIQQRRMGFRLLILILTAIVGASALAKTAEEEACEARLDGEWRQTQDLVKNGKYNQSRHLFWYLADFTAPGVPPLLTLLAELKRKAVWMDFGAGEAGAMRQALATSHYKNIAKLIATSFERPRANGLSDDLETYSDRFSFIETGYVHEALKNPKHAIYKWKGKVDFLTDDFGPSSYAFDLQQIFDFYTDILADNGKALVLFHRTRLHRGDEWESDTFCDEIIKPYIPQITGGALNIVSSGKSLDGNCIVLFERVPRSKVRAPAKRHRLEPMSFEHDIPPVRSYRIN